MYISGQSFSVEVNGQGANRDYTIEVVFGSDNLTESGKVANNDDLVSLSDYLHNSASARLHRAIDAALTEERIARHLFAWCRENLPPLLQERLIEVRVFGRFDTWAAYRAVRS